MAGLLSSLIANSRIRLSIWALLMAAVLTTGLWQAQQGFTFRADVLALLPEVQRNPAVAAAVKQTAEQSQQYLALAFLPDAATAQQASVQKLQALAHQLQTQLNLSGLFGAVQVQQKKDNWNLARYSLLTDALRDKIASQPDALLEQTSAALYGLSGAASPVALATDPLQLATQYQLSFAPAGFEPLTTNVILGGTDEQYLLASVSMKGSAFDARLSQRLLDLLANLQTWADAEGGRLLVGGVPVFAAHGAAQARGEISLFGSISLAAVITLMLAVFASIRPLLGTLACIGCGLGAGLVATHWLFGEVHLLTLVFGAGLIGISVDYAMHFLCDGYTQHNVADLPPGQRGNSPNQQLLSVGPGITLAMLTSVAAFLSFLITPFPGLQQIAVFAAVGLFVAWLTVVALLPVLGWRPQPDRGLAARLLPVLRNWGANWPMLGKRVALAVAVLLAILALTGLVRLQPNDNVQVLQSTPAHLLADYAALEPLLPYTRASQFFLIQDNNPDTLLDHEQKLLAALTDSGVAPDEVFALSNYYPRAEIQHQDYTLIREQYYTQPRLRNWYTRLGVDAGTIEANEREFSATDGIPLAAWVAAAPAHLQSLWLGCDDGTCRSIVALLRVTDKAAMQATADALPGITWVDQVATLSNTLRTYRELATRSLLIVYALATLVLMFLFGWRAGLRMICVPGCAAALAIACSTLLGNPFSLFSLLALMVVVGISVDYAVFYHLHGRTRPSTSLAITLSTLTTVLAFGLLAFSSTTVVHTFGMTLFFGIISAFLLAPLAATQKNIPTREESV